VKLFWSISSYFGASLISRPTYGYGYIFMDIHIYGKPAHIAPFIHNTSVTNKIDTTLVTHRQILPIAPQLKKA